MYRKCHVVELIRVLRSIVSRSILCSDERRVVEGCSLEREAGKAYDIQERKCWGSPGGSLPFIVQPWLGPEGETPRDGAITRLGIGEAKAL